jgi:hypothetical protein
VRQGEAHPRKVIDFITVDVYLRKHPVCTHHLLLDELEDGWHQDFFFYVSKLPYFFFSPTL